jgi:hypothetical protein
MIVLAALRGQLLLHVGGRIHRQNESRLKAKE